MSNLVMTDILVNSVRMQVRVPLSILETFSVSLLSECRLHMGWVGGGSCAMKNHGESWKKAKVKVMGKAKSEVINNLRPKVKS